MVFLTIGREEVYGSRVAHVPDDSVQLAETFGAVARALGEYRDDVQQGLDKVVRLAVETLDACEFAGISLAEGRKITSPASTNDTPKRLDEIQSETGEGPCIEAIREHEVFQTGDLRNESRWPKFSERAHRETGVRSILSLRLFVEEDTLGALNMYSTASDAFDDSDVALGTVFAVHAAVAMSAARRQASLEQKADSRDLIGQAKGILMARSDISDDRAFELLKAASQRMNVKLRDIAKDVVERKPPPDPPA